MIGGSAATPSPSLAGSRPATEAAPPTTPRSSRRGSHPGVNFVGTTGEEHNDPRPCPLCVATGRGEIAKSHPLSTCFSNPLYPKHRPSLVKARIDMLRGIV